MLGDVAYSDEINVIVADLNEEETVMDDSLSIYENDEIHSR